MVVAHHLIFTAYGCWLPNDPRGSCSNELRADHLASLGEIHEGRKRVQPSSNVLRDFYRQADELLAHTRQLFNDDDVSELATCFAQILRNRTYTCYACAIMPDHVHMLIRRHRDKAEQMMEHFLADTKTGLIAAERRPADHPVWGGPGWKVFLNTRAAIENVVKYIKNNPIKIGRPEQRWDFVTEYDGWMPPLRLR